MQATSKEQMPKEKRIMISCAVFIILLGVAIGGHLYRNSSMKALNQYVGAINNRNYIGAYQMFYDSKQIKDFSQEYVTKYIGEYFEDNELIKLETGKIMSNSVLEQTQQKLVTYKATYYFQNKTINAVIGVIKDETDWKIIFPFKTEEVKIYAPIGAEVIVDNKKMITGQNQDYMKVDLFPGDYTVKIQYPEDVKEDYIAEVSVPKQTEVYSPYKDYTIEVEAPLHSVVELAGNTLENTEGKVVFKNVIEGDYTLKIYDKNGSLDEYSQKVSVGEGKTYFKVDSINLSPIGYEKISTFTNDFYRDYLQGIRQGKNTFFDEYLQSDEADTIMKEYNDWFIDKKDLVDAKINIEIQQVRLKNAAEVEMQVLEVVTLKNKEKDRQVDYQIVLKWGNLIDISTPHYKIKERYLMESLVSYKDNEGNWLQY